MFDYEGSRSEFLKLLAECGEEPAFIARARAPELALDELFRTCEAKRIEMLKWPTFHLSALAHQIRNDWARLSLFLAVPESVSMLETLHASMHTNDFGGTDWLASDKKTFHQFVDSAERFNRKWLVYVNGIDLEPVNKPRRDFNQYYVLEKACAFGSERVTQGFEPLGMIGSEYLHGRFPALALPALA